MTQSDGKPSPEPAAPVSAAAQEVVTVHVTWGRQLYFMETPASSRASLAAIFRDREYDVLALPGWRPEVIVDAGAHVGAFALWASLKWPDAQVLSFEPAAANYQLLVRNLSGQANVVTAQLALLDQDSEPWLFHGRNNPGENSLTRGAQQQDVGERVRAGRLSSELSKRRVERVGILKIDTEGAEVPILRDVAALLPGIDFIVLEYHRDRDRATIDGLLAENFLLFGGTILGFHRGVLKYVNRRLLVDLGEAGEYLRAEASR